jgi:two-component sensor histidine kinase
LEALIEPPAEPKQEQKVNILLVDDRPENLIALESVLQVLDQNLVTARSGRDALKHVLEDDFACILLDVQMPDMNGFETATLIRSRKRSQHTPILFLTAINKSETHVATGYQIGAVDYVFKPFEPEVLRAKVSAFVELSRKTRELEDEVNRRKLAEEEIRTLNLELERRVRERTAALEATNRELQSEIAERRRAEEALKEKQADIEALNQRLQRAMTETHHRVKNNLQIIAAMVDMRLMEGAATIDPAEIKRLGTHVQTLASVHDILTQEAKYDGQAEFLSAQEVLLKLVDMLQRTSANRKIVASIGNARLTARQGTSLALVLNELVSNAQKYGKGEIGVSFTVEGQTAILAVSDDGPGFPAEFDPNTAANTGLELICSLSQWDLGGEARFENRPEGGARVVVKMPLPTCPED